MKLWELQKGDIFDAPDIGEELYRFDHCDGMYSVCYNTKREVVHLSVLTPVRLIARQDHELFQDPDQQA